MKLLAINAQGITIEVDFNATLVDAILSGPEADSGLYPSRFWDLGVLFDPDGNVLTEEF